MWLFGFYRIYLCLCAGIAFWFFCIRSIWLSLAVVVAARLLWFGLEKIIEWIEIGRDFKQHIYPFKQLLGPYGIRLANKAEKEWHIKKTLPRSLPQTPQGLKKTWNSSR